MNLFDKDFKEMFWAQIASTVGGLLAGFLLAVYTDKLLLLPGMLVLLPGFLEMRGNISGTLASRLSSGLFLEVINPRKPTTKIIKGNLIASFMLAIFISLVLGILAFLLTGLVLGIWNEKIVALSLIAGIIANLVEIPLTFLSTFYLFRRGIDPNNLMGPLLTSTGDVSSILALLIALWII